MHLNKLRECQLAHGVYMFGAGRSFGSECAMFICGFCAVFSTLEHVLR